MKRQIILGMGAGQCGGNLLASVLDGQPNAKVTHEEPPFLPWYVKPGAPGVRQRLERILERRSERFIGDVASFYLPYVEQAIQFDPDIRIICLQRPCEEVVAGFSRSVDKASTVPTNYWCKELPPGWFDDPMWTRIFPKYDTPDRSEALRLYWSEYYERAEALIRRFPDNIRLWDTTVLTTQDGVREVLTFAGIPQGRLSPLGAMCVSCRNVTCDGRSGANSLGLCVAQSFHETREAGRRAMTRRRRPVCDPFGIPMIDRCGTEFGVTLMGKGVASWVIGGESCG